jgi:TolB-like protein
MMIKRVVTLPLVWLFGFFLFTVSGCVTTQPKPDGIKLRIAVLDFANNGGNHRQGLSDFFADRMTHELYRRERFELVERGEVNAALSLEKIDKPADELSTEEVRRIGKRLSTDALVLGEITEYQAGDFETGPSRVGVLVRVVSCKDGGLMAMERTRVKSKKGDLVSLSERVVAEATGELMKTFTKAEEKLRTERAAADTSLVPVGQRGKK